MDEGKLLKTLRVTKNMLLLSEQLPNEDYNSQKNNKKEDDEKAKNDNNTIYNTTKSTKNSLSNITSNHHLNATTKENNKDTVWVIFMKQFL